MINLFGAEGFYYIYQSDINMKNKQKMCSFCGETYVVKKSFYAATTHLKTCKIWLIRKTSSRAVENRVAGDVKDTIVPVLQLKDRNTRKRRKPQVQPGPKPVFKHFGPVPKEAEERNIYLDVVDVKADQPTVWLEVANSAYQGLMDGYNPERTEEGSGGCYFMMNGSGKCVAVFKPVDEEPMALNIPRELLPTPDGEGIKIGTTPGLGAFKEVAAYLLDHPKAGRRSSMSLSGEHQDGSAGVPPTFLVTCFQAGFHHPTGTVQEKTGSLQMFVENNGSCMDRGSGDFSEEEVHKIIILDIRLANTDRHGGNILLKEGEDGNYMLVPIDHGYCLPTSFEECTFEWLDWPQARRPFSSESVEYISSMDAEEDIKLLNSYGWRLPPACAHTLKIIHNAAEKGSEERNDPSCDWKQDEKRDLE